MFGQALQFLLETALDLLTLALLMRFYMQTLRVSFRNPVGEFVVALTDWLARPARRVIPGLFGFDLASFTLAWAMQVVLLLLLYWIKGFVFAGTPGIAAGILLTLALLEVIKLSVYLLIFLIIVQVLFSWVNPDAPLAPLFNSLARPFLRPFRRLIPPIGNVDLSPLFVLVLAQLALILIAHGYRVIAGMF
ncbi:MAG TPA: YggT family protein [Burkholderiales bacterium]|nr:YggT family protein [Burkholderiales bacterium]